VLHARIGKGVKSEKKGNFGGLDKGVEIFRSDGIELQLSQQSPLENFASKSGKNILSTVRLKI
jgi:hypothetical protein